MLTGRARARSFAALATLACAVFGRSAAADEATDDFAARCASADVVKCVGFDDPADIAGDSQDNSGILSGASTPALDASTRASGASSILFTIPSNSPADTSGSYFTNFSEDLSVQFGGSTELYVQWRQRFSTEFLTTDYPGGGGWKQVIIGTGDQPGQPYYSCTDLEVVTVNGYHRGFPEMYNSCSGSASHGAYDPFEEPFGSSDFKLQNARPDPYCLYSQGKTDPPSFFPPAGNCFAYAADEWMTFQVGIQTGARVGDEFKDSHVKLWLAREGQPSELVMDWGPYNLTAGDPALNEAFGKVWLLPYNTGKDPSASHATAYTWYDELVISRVKVPDPGAPPTGSGSASASGAGGGPSGAGPSGAGGGANPSSGPSGPSGAGTGGSTGAGSNETAGDDSGCACGAAGVGPSGSAAALASLALLAGITARRKRRWTVAAGAALAAWLGTCATARAGVLEDAAANLAPGTWIEIPTQAMVETLTDTGGSSGMTFGYAEELKWDSVTRRLVYIGMDHGQLEGERFVVFQEDDATWAKLPVEPWMAWSGTPSHGYDHHAIDTARRFFYFRYPFGGRSVYRYDLDAASWTQLADNEPLEYTSCCGALEYFPELDGIVWVQAGEVSIPAGLAGGVFLYTESSGAWTRLGDKGVYEMGTYQNFAEYLPGHGVMVFGGGNDDGRKLYTLDGAGQIKALAEAPIDVGVHQAVHTADPSSGELLVLTADQQFYAYDVTSDSWGELPAPTVDVWTPSYGNAIHGVVAAPIETYGVIAYARCDIEDCHLYLYRHAEGSGVPPPATGAGGGGGAGPTGSAGVGPGATSGAGASPATTTAGSGGGSAALPADNASDAGGCACRTEARSTDGWFALALAAAVTGAARRRRSRCR